MGLIWRKIARNLMAHIKMCSKHLPGSDRFVYFSQEVIKIMCVEPKPGTFKKYLTKIGTKLNNF